jgi:UDP-N-acetylglucosamine 2-epimerase
MRVLIVGTSGNADALAEAVEANGLAVERRPDGSPAATGPEEIAAIARELREFERALGDGGADAVVVVSHSSACLAAVLVATKLGTPVAGIDGQAGDADGANARLIRQLADIELAPDTSAIVSWLRDTYTERP